MLKKYLLSETQQGFYYDWLRHPDLTEYNVPYLYRYSRNIDADRLEHALDVFLHNHPIYYTRIISENGKVCQYPDLERPIPIERLKMEEKDIEKWTTKFVRPFDLYKDPLIHAAIVETPESVYLFFDTQHMVSDGTTMMLFFDELNAAYCGKELYPEKDTFFDYIAQEKASFETDEYKAARDYFHAKFNGLSMSKIGTQHSEKVGNLLHVSRMVSSDKVDTFCKANGVTPNLLLMAGFAYALSIFSGDEKAVFYTVNHGRTERRFRKSYGPFIKSTPILADCANEITVLELIQSLKREIMGTIRYGVYPFSHFCQDLSIVPECSFTFQAGIEEKAQLGDESIHIQALPTGRVNSNMAVVIFYYDGNYEIRLEYNENRHHLFEMTQFVQCIYDCVENMMLSPNALLADFKWMPSAQQSKLLDLSTGEQRNWGDKTFLDLFKEQVKATPDRIAVVDEKNQLTYKELDSYSNALASVLVSKGVQKNEFVGIQMPRNKEWLIAIIGIFKAGAAYLPLASDNPDARIQYILEDSGVKFVLTEKDLVLTDAEHDFNEVSVTPDDLAYMIYTSGSTGKPKGVMITHRALSNFAQSCKELYQLDEKDKIFCHSSFSFDASVEDLFAVLTCGGQLHILLDSIVREPTRIADYIQTHQLTGGNFTTRLGVEMLKHYDLPLKYLTLGGERLDTIPQTSIKLFNSYGPTEFTVDATFQELNSLSSKTIPIGRPITNSYAFVLDKNHRLVPQGCVGNLYLAGPQLSKGYWNRPELTKQRFVTNPFAENPGCEQMYDTGDLVWWNEDGALEFVGRADKQVKISGYRIETGEIENVLIQYEGIRGVVVDIKVIGGIQRICAYYLTETPISENSLREYLGKALPAYMIPWKFIHVDSFPLMPSGKVDLLKLPVPALNTLDNYVAPETVEERVLERILCKILGTDFLGVETNMFSFGLTSLQAMQVSFEAESVGVRVPVSTLYEEGTIRGALKSLPTQYYWVGSINDSKPLMVLICGYPYSHPFYDQYINFFKEKFTILVMESFLNSPLQHNITTPKIIEYYMEVLSSVMDQREISIIGGFCLGSELSLHLATRLKKDHGISPKVLIMNGFFFRPKEEPDLIVMGDSIHQKHSLIAANVINTLPPIDYDGEIIIAMSKFLSRRLDVESNEEEKDENRIIKAHQSFVENRNRWKKEYPTAPYVDVEAEHWAFFEERPLAQLWNAMKKYWKFS